MVWKMVIWLAPINVLPLACDQSAYVIDNIVPISFLPLPLILWPVQAQQAWDELSVHVVGQRAGSRESK